MRELHRLSIVVPMHNEENNILAMHRRVTDALVQSGTPWELIFVDDGSTDNSEHLLRELHRRDMRVRIVFLSRNFGHEAACTAGLDAADGDAVVLMDADLQDPPEVIPEMIEQWKLGFDIVSGRRRRRTGDSIAKRASAWLFYRAMRLIVRWEFPRDIGNFRLMDRAVVYAFRKFPERNRFVRALTAWTGFKQTTVVFDRDKRNAGDSKYSAIKIFGLALTSLTAFSNLPLRIGLYIGLFLGIGSIVAAIALVFLTAMGRDVPSWSYTLTSVWFLGGLQCMLLGFIGEYVGRVYTETRGRPIYIVRDMVGGPAVTIQSVEDDEN
jgi:glycosyltransferase involved in cell wall biosynthesis